jgi:membrane peptidoglycan carboxypeptidase
MARTKSGKPTPKRRPSSADETRQPTMLSLLFLWPFHLFHYTIRHRPMFVRFLLRLIGDPCIAGLYVLLFISIIYGARAKQYDLTKIHEMPERSVILDRRGEELARMHGEIRDIISLDQVSADFRKAILAREDERFYSHGAFDPIGIVRAAYNNMQGKREGASTITQQLASDVFKLKQYGVKQSKLQLIDRKFLEIAIAYRIEKHLGSKDRVLEAYLNSINWGRSIRGIQEASRIYFEKNASELNLSESAMLAGIVRGPDAFNPFNNMDAAIRERNSTLERMVNAKVISRAQADEAKAQALDIRPANRRKVRESYALDAIRRDLEIILEKENIEFGGLIITTTIDNLIQSKAEEAVEATLSKIEKMPGYPHQTRAQWQAIPEGKKTPTEYIQGAAVVIENHTGAVLAFVGGRSADESKFNRAIQAKRQIGSVFKPFVYLAAFDKGLRPDTMISDGYIASGEIKGAPSNWHPKNSDGTYGGPHPVSYGLIKSRNTMSVRVGNHAGLSNVAHVCEQAFNHKMQLNPSSYLGSWEATPYQVASAYSMLPNGGVRYRPFLISSIRKRNGDLVYETPPLPYQAASPGSAYSVSKILEEVTTSGTANSVKRLGFDKPCAGKTGTTNNFKDAWFAGYTSSLTCAVWCGMDEPKRTIQGGYGSTLSLPIWVDIMKTADRLGYKANPFQQMTKNSGLVSCTLCKSSGKRATAGCHAANTSYVDQVPSDIAPAANDWCPVHPARAIPVEEDEAPSPTAPLRAVPIEEPARPALRAVPVEEPSRTPLRAQPVEE